LEEGYLAVRHRRQSIVDCAVELLESDLLFPLISAFRAEGRLMTAEEANAKQAFQHVVSSVCRSARFSTGDSCEGALDVSYFMKATGQCTRWWRSTLNGLEPRT
jgi:hypothetical protein